MSVSEQNKQRVLQFFLEVLNDGRLELIDDLVAKDFIGRLTCVGAAITGPDGMRRFVSLPPCRSSGRLCPGRRPDRRGRPCRHALASDGRRPSSLGLESRGAGLPGDHNHPPTGGKTGRRVHPVRVAVSSRVTSSQGCQGQTVGSPKRTRAPPKSPKRTSAAADPADFLRFGQISFGRKTAAAPMRIGRTSHPLLDAVVDAGHPQPTELTRATRHTRPTPPETRSRVGPRRGGRVQPGLLACRWSVR